LLNRKGILAHDFQRLFNPADSGAEMLR
jgi:hypothetical protein